jgi:hypothetical protein
MQKFRNPFATDRRDNAKLGKVRADRIDHCSLLADVVAPVSPGCHRG